MTPVVVAMAFAASISCPSGIVPCKAPPVPPTVIRSPYGVLWAEPLKLSPVPEPFVFEVRQPWPAPRWISFQEEMWKVPPGEKDKCLKLEDASRGKLRWVDCVTQK